VLDGQQFAQLLKATAPAKSSLDHIAGGANVVSRSARGPAPTVAFKLRIETVNHSISSLDELRDAERKLLIETMRPAGFPPCAKADQLKGIESPVRLPECGATAAP
jgi:hypothetical protein